MNTIKSDKESENEASYSSKNVFEYSEGEEF
jgi:hypothetical protein